MSKNVFFKAVSENLISFYGYILYGDDNVYRCCYDSKGIDFYR